MTASNLLALLVVIPLFAAPLCIVLRQRTLVFFVTALVTLTSALMSTYLLVEIDQSRKIIEHAMGGWVAPFGIVYRMDMLSAIITNLVTWSGFIVTLYARKSVAQNLPGNKVYLYYAALLLCITGLAGISVTADIFNVFVFLEISSLSAYTLISLGKHRKALLASFRYLILGTLGATFFLIGIGLLYANTGTLNMGDMQKLLSGVKASQSVIAGFAFIVLGLCVKAAVFPFHRWLPDAYGYAPSPVAAFFAACATKVALYALIRILWSVFSLDGKLIPVVQAVPVYTVLLGLSAVAVIWASWHAIQQTNIRKLLAYSSIAQIAYMVMGIGLANKAGLQASVVHMFNHAVIKCGLFLVAGNLVYRMGRCSMQEMQGMAKNMPLTAAALVLAGLSLIGVPLTAGFISKWYLLAAILKSPHWWLLVPVIVSSLMAIIYVWKLVEAAYFKPLSPDATPVREAPVGMLIPLGLLIALNIYFGLDTRVATEYSELMWQQLFAG